MPVADPDFPDILQHFELTGHFESAEPFGNGHINDTFLVRINHFDARKRYVLQRINSDVFLDPAGVMENIDRVTRHIRELPPARFAARLSKQASFVPIAARSGEPWWQDPSGSFWRLWPFIYGARTVSVPASRSQAREAARAFGTLQCLLQELPRPPLRETIAGFHDTVARLAQFRQALGADRFDRARNCQPEIEFALGCEEFVQAFCELANSGTLPMRVAHNDAKMDNVLLSEETGEAVCIVDFDTVMPGLAHYDFGDMVRTMTIAVAEDHVQADEVHLQIEMYTAVAEGFLEATGSFLTDDEVQNLPDAGKIITYETGLRFLTDHLAGDEYFRTSRENQNLDRCRAQFALVRSIDEQLDTMRSITTRLAS